MTTYCCGIYNGKVKCTHPKAPKKNVLFMDNHRPIWCPITIIPIEQVRQVLDDKENNR